MHCPSWDALIEQTTQFSGSCYSKVLKERPMSDYRYKIWATNNSVELQPLHQKSQPPTTEAFMEKVKTAHKQTCDWQAALCCDPPLFDPTQFGNTRHEPSRSLLPVTVPSDVPLAIPEVMDQIKCEGSSPCRTLRCSCICLKLPCTLFCKCNARRERLNDPTKTVKAPTEVRD